MSERAALARRLVESLNRMDADGFESILHLDARYTAPGSDLGTDIVGRYPIIEYFKRIVFPTFERLDYQVAHLWESADAGAVVVEWRCDLWTTTGRHYLNTGVFVLEFLDNLVYWVREYHDTEKAHRGLTGAADVEP